ncbi:uncharacterized protein LOC134237969 [Saccostrea cucullata]|uniref:uncharacterized protein LOC134237969 n=1 Tax=Saccostrea cuccullata TaxID=36930 RepID=UPI002ED697C0
MPLIVLEKSVKVPGVRRSRHISLVTSNLVWISDNGYNLILTNTEGVKLYHLTDIDSGSTGVHTVTSDGDLIYIDNGLNINKLSAEKKVKTTLIKYAAPWKPRCVYSSPSTGDLLVAIYNTDTKTGQVNRYNNTGEHIQTIPHDNTGQGLYSVPTYITENRNGDVIVSDYHRSVLVVTDREGRHRFSYTGPPLKPKESGVEPRGICTDALSHILVCDDNTRSVQIIDKDGHFQSLTETKQHGINVPCGLSYDGNTSTLWVGSGNNNTVNIYKLSYGGDDLTDPSNDDLIKVDELKRFLRKEKTTVSHARGILVGCAEAGKTTLLKRLRGQSQNIREDTDSTRGLEVHQHLFLVKDGVLEARRTGLLYTNKLKCWCTVIGSGEVIQHSRIF